MSPLHTLAETSACTARKIDIESTYLPLEGKATWTWHMHDLSQRAHALLSCDMRDDMCNVWPSDDRTLRHSMHAICKLFRNR